MNRLSACTTTLLLSMSIGHAGLISPQSLLDLEQEADLIVVASASGSVQLGSVASLSLRVARVLKGEATLPGSVVAASWDATNPGVLFSSGASIPFQGNGLWFLKRSPTGLTVVPVVQGSASPSLAFFPQPSSVPIPAAYAYVPTAQLSDKIAAELSFAIESAGAEDIPQLSFLEEGMLDDLNSRMIQTLYQRQSSSAIIQQRILGLSGLVRAGSAAAFASAAQAESQFEPYATENGVLLRSIRDRFRPTDSNSVSALGRAVSSSTTGQALREAAAHALASIHTAPALPYLAGLLDDPDPKLRIEAIGGMCAFANGLPVQTPATVASMAYLQPSGNAPYRTADTLAHFAMGSQAIEKDESAYVAFWESWWAQNRASLGY